MKYSFSLTPDAQQNLTRHYTKTLRSYLLGCFCFCLQRGLRQVSTHFGIPLVYLHAIGTKDSTVTANIADIEKMTSDLLASLDPSPFLSLEVDVGMRLFNLTEGTNLVTFFAKRLSIADLDFSSFGGHIYPQAMTYDLINYQASYSKVSSYRLQRNRRGYFQSANFYSGYRQRLAPEGVMPLANISKLPGIFLFSPLLPVLRNVWGCPLRAI